jgi:hypothetical protein
MAELLVCAGGELDVRTRFVLMTGTESVTAAAEFVAEGSGLSPIGQT